MFRRSRVTVVGGPAGVPPLPIGGDHSLRGPKAYTLLTPTATVASPYGLTEFHAARDAAGVNGVVRIPAAASGSSVAPTLSVNGQIWQLETAATVMNGNFLVTGVGVTIEGGKMNGQLTFGDGSTTASGGPHPAPVADFTIRNVEFNPGAVSTSILILAKSGFLIQNCTFNLTTDVGMGGIFFGNMSIDGFVFENCIGIRTGGTNQSMIGGNNDVGGSPPGQVRGIIKNFRVTNCYIDGGTAAQGHYGIEVWGGRANAQGRGSTVEYSDLRGGDCMTSMVGTDQTNNWVHHNKFTFGGAGQLQMGNESAGPGCTGSIYEYNETVSTEVGTPTGQFVSHNSEAAHHTVRFNKFTDLFEVVSTTGHADPAATGGGGYVVEDNCLNNVTHVAYEDDPRWVIPNVENRNDATACGY